MTDQPKMGPEREFSSQSGAPTLGELLTEHDAAEDMLCMRYSKYLDRPTERGMREITTALAEEFDSFGELLVEVVKHEDLERAAAMLATLIHTMAEKHSRLLADYDAEVQLPTEEEAKEARIMLADSLSQFETASELTDAAIDHIREIRDGDMELIQRIVLERSDRPSERLKSVASKGSIDIVKIGAGVVLGLFVYDKLKK